MRATTVVLGVVLLATTSASAFAIHHQRESILLASSKSSELERALGQRDVAMHERDQQLALLKANVAKLEADRGAQAKSLAELAPLQRERDAARARAEQLTKLVSQFQKLIDSGKLQVEIRHGRLVLVLPNDVLFDEGKVAIKSDGQSALGEIAATLKNVQGRQFEVIGHTDATPIKTAEFPSNWDLSSARALAVVKLLVDAGVSGGVLAATGRGEWEPHATNGNAFGRMKNRRIEIVLEPLLPSDLKLPQLKM